tara:strand:+ start:327 stop:533 length:207 start_codon:yes stop_codon:yes gene_type:complete
MDQGITVMIIGMATVFAFLILLILAINLTSSYFIKHADRFDDYNSGHKNKDSKINIAIALAAIKAKRG